MRRSVRTGDGGYKQSPLLGPHSPGLTFSYTPRSPVLTDTESSQISRTRTCGKTITSELGNKWINKLFVINSYVLHGPSQISTSDFVHFTNTLEKHFPFDSPDLRIL